MHFKQNHQAGFTLVEILVGVAMLGGLSLGVAQLMKNMNDDQAQGLARDDMRTLTNMISTTLSNPKNCKDSINAILNTAGELTQASGSPGLPIPNIYRDTSVVTNSVGSKLGRVTIQGMNLRNYNTTLKRAELEIVGNFKKSATVSMQRSQIIPLNADLTAAGVVQCASASAGLDDLWKMMPIPLAGVFYNQGSVLVGSGEADTGTSVPAMAFGTNNNVYATNAMATGSNNSIPANAINGMALGSNNDVGGAHSVAIGSDNNVGNVAADGGYAVALGYSNFVNKRFGMALGYNHSISSEGGFALGNFNSVSGGNAFAIGTVAEASADFAVAIGNDITASGLRSLSVGYNAVAGGASAVSVGANTTAAGNNDISIGNGSTILSTTTEAVSIGTNATNDGNKAINIGMESKIEPGAYEGVAIGAYAEAREGTAVVVGSLAWGGFGDVILGTEAKGGSGPLNYAIAIGAKAMASEGKAIAMGAEAAAAKVETIAIGYKASARGATGQSIAIGSSAQGMDSGTISIGSGSFASSDNSISIGKDSNSYGSRNITLGFDSKGYNDNAIAIGYQARAGDFGISLGSQAESSRNIAIGSNVKNAVDDSAMIATDGATATQPSAPGEFAISFKTVTICHQPAVGGICPLNQKLASTATGWVVVSDKNLKKDFKEVDANEILSNLLQLDISTWRYKNESNSSKRHLGPMAQDFYRLFAKPLNIDGDDKTLNPNTLTMVNTVAIQALHKKVISLEKENSDLKSEMLLIRESICEINPKAKVCVR